MKTLKSDQSQTFKQLNSCSLPQQTRLTVSYFAGTRARKRGHFWAAFASLNFNDWWHCCTSRENPLLQEMQTHAAGCRRTMPQTHTHTHVCIIILNNATKTSRRQTDKNTHTHTVVTTALQRVAQSDPLGTMVLFEWLKQKSSLASESSQMMRIPGG